MRHPSSTAARRSITAGLCAAIAVAGMAASATPASAAPADAASVRTIAAAQVATPQSIIGKRTTPPGGAQPQSSTVTGPYSPSQIQSMYGITGTDLANASGTVVAIIDANVPHDIESVLGTYRSTFGLPACTRSNGCLVTTDQHGTPIDPSTTSISEDSAWRFEAMLDVEAVSAACPSCRIMLLDAASAGLSDLGDATNAATAAGAHYVSMSFAVGEFDGQLGTDSYYYGAPGVTYVAASGDSGYSGGVAYPASSSNVVAAGGTSVTRTNGVWNTTAWSGAGSGCSAFDSATTGEAHNAVVTATCQGKKPTADVAALADPNTGLQVYVPGPNGAWYAGGGTSLAAPLVAAIYALAANHTAPFAPFATAAARPNLFADVTTGSTSGCPAGSGVRCTAAPGWDGPTGLGSPLAPAAFTATGTGAVPPPDTSNNGDNGTGSQPGTGKLPPAVHVNGRPVIQGAVRSRHRVRALYSISVTGLRTSAAPVRIEWILNHRRVATGRVVKVLPGWVGKQLFYRITFGAGGSALAYESARVRVRR